MINRLIKKNNNNREKATKANIIRTLNITIKIFANKNNNCIFFSQKFHYQYEMKNNKAVIQHGNNNDGSKK